MSSLRCNQRPLCISRSRRTKPACSSNKAWFDIDLSFKGSFDLILPPSVLKSRFLPTSCPYAFSPSVPPATSKEATVSSEPLQAPHTASSLTPFSGPIPEKMIKTKIALTPPRLSIPNRAQTTPLPTSMRRRSMRISRRLRARRPMLASNRMGV